MLIKYMGEQPVFQYPQGSTLGGHVASLPVSLRWGASNNWTIDTTASAYSGVAGATWTYILTITQGPQATPIFRDVTSVSPVPDNLWQLETTNDPQVSQKVINTFLTKADIIATGLAAIDVGAVPTDITHIQIGAPTTGVHVAGEVFIDSKGAIWACQTSGTPGMWFAAGSGVELAEAELASDFTMLNAATDITGLSITFIAPARPFVLELSIPMSTFNVTSQNSQVWIADSANNVIQDGYLLTGSGTQAGIPYFNRARLPKVGGANAYPIVPGNQYTFKARQALSSTAVATINTAGGRDRPILRAVTC